MQSNKHIPDSMNQIVSGIGNGNSAIATKVMEDIHFLKDRIERIRKLQTPNSTVLRTYQSMLESRESVLAWLMENDDADISADTYD